MWIVVSYHPCCCCYNNSDNYESNHYIPLQKSSVGACRFLETKYKPTLHKNQYMLVIHACLQQYLLLLCTMNMFLSFIVVSTDKGLNFNHCSNSSDTTKPIAKI